MELTFDDLLEYEFLVNMTGDYTKEECAYKELRKCSNRCYNCYLDVSNKECD